METLIIGFPGKFHNVFFIFKTRFQDHAVFPNFIKLGFLFSYFCIQFRFRAHMISFLGIQDYIFIIPQIECLPCISK